MLHFYVQCQVSCVDAERVVCQIGIKSTFGNFHNFTVHKKCQLFHSWRKNSKAVRFVFPSNFTPTMDYLIPASP